MRMMKSSSVPALALGLIMMTLVGQCYGQLKIGFYNGKCKTFDVEREVFGVVQTAFAKDSNLAAALLRMQFHDCFVRGCDASLLLDGANTEKTAIPNLSVRGYEVIDAAKAAVEKLCPGVVSCADIIAIATRVSVYLAKGTWYNVETGRRDGRTSMDTDALNSLPAPNVPVPQAVSMFQAKNITTQEFVLLLAGHTVGITHCFLIHDRLYNYNGIPGASDPNINPRFLPVLKQTCPSDGDGTNILVLDQVSPQIVDNGFLKSIVDRRGILQVDQDIAFDPLTKNTVSRYAASNSAFNTDFGKAMVKLGRIDCLTGKQGEIRTSCRSVNSY